MINQVTKTSFWTNFINFIYLTCNLIGTREPFTESIIRQHCVCMVAPQLLTVLVSLPCMSRVACIAKPTGRIPSVQIPSYIGRSIDGLAIPSGMHGIRYSMTVLVQEDAKKQTTSVQ